MSQDRPTFLLDQALCARDRPRSEAGAAEEHFGLGQLIGMLSDEIDLARGAGLDDDAIIEAIAETTGHRLTHDTLVHFYAPPKLAHLVRDKGRYGRCRLRCPLSGEMQ